VLSLLYSPTRGAGLTILRNEIGADAGFTIEPRAPSSPGGKPSYLAYADWNYAQQFTAAIETGKAANAATALFTSHGYFVAPDSPSKGWSKPVRETEWAPFGFQPWDPAWDDGSLSSGPLAGCGRSRATAGSSARARCAPARRRATRASTTSNHDGRARIAAYQ
jgi:hypothetical protein